MPSLSHGRVYLIVGLCFVVLFFVLKFQHSSYSDGAFPFLKQYSHLSNTPRDGIANDTFGFEKIFVINAPWRTDRKDSISLAASYSGLTLEWIKGVEAKSIEEKAYPPGNHREISHGNRGSWRAHMDALRENVLTIPSGAHSDDADWDFRIRSILTDFSHGVRRLPELITQSELHSRNPPEASDEKLSQLELAKRSSISVPPLSGRSIPKSGPYGRDWDVLWLGHCGAQLSPSSPHSPDRITIPNDPTVPEPQHLKPMSQAKLDQLGSLYPPHTRVIHRANSTLCTIAYAVTQSGARKLLYEFGIREFNKGYDFAVSDFCNGLTRGAKRETMPLCITVQPPIFSHHFPVKMKSDIMGVGAGGKEVGTRYVRWSVRMNLERLVKGEEGIVEQWEDDKKAS